MDRIAAINFFDSFAKAEAIANDAQVKPDISYFNQKLEDLHAFSTEDMHVHFGMYRLRKLLSPETYDNFKDAPPFEPARLFRLDRYLLESGGDAWGFFASQVGQSGDRVLFHLYIASEVEGQLKVIRQFFLDTLDSGERVWTPSGGDESITLESLGKPVEIHRLLEPSDDADSMKIYLAD